MGKLTPGPAKKPPPEPEAQEAALFRGLQTLLLVPRSLILRTPLQRQEM